VALGCEDRQGRFDDVMLLVGDQLVQGSVYRLLAEHGDALFSDEYFADLFKRSALGRPTVPARVVATVMLLQAYEGLSDREACDRLAFDLRWKAAAGLTVAAGAFHPTVLVGMRNRLRKSDRPRRLFDDVNTTARAAGLLRGRRRVLDSTPLFDAVATQDTVIQLRAAIRKVLAAADRVNPQLATAVRATLTRDDDYATLGKPPCDWDDPNAREALVDALVRDAQAALTALEGHELDGPLAPAAELLALVAGQDVEAGEDGVFRIARRVARDRLISTVDVAARHGHKSRARTFDGYKTHLNVDPDDELITNVSVTAANTPDRQVIDELLDEPGTDTEPATDEPADGTDTDTGPDGGSAPKDFEVYGDSAYADGPPCTSRPSGATTCTPRCPRYATPMAIPKTSSASTCRPAPSPARPTTPWPSATASATVQRASVHYVDPVHCGRPARKPVADGSSASTPTKPPYNTPKPARKTPSGSRPTAPIAPSWNARSATSPTAPGAAEKPAAADTPAS
jgi:hypothetical protein